MLRSYQFHFQHPACVANCAHTRGHTHTHIYGRVSAGLKRIALITASVADSGPKWTVRPLSEQEVDVVWKRSPIHQDADWTPIKLPCVWIQITPYPFLCCVRAIHEAHVQKKARVNSVLSVCVWACVDLLYVSRCPLSLVPSLLALMWLCPPSLERAQCSLL